MAKCQGVMPNAAGFPALAAREWNCITMSRIEALDCAKAVSVELLE
jgi:hypothetical protein